MASSSGQVTAAPDMTGSSTEEIFKKLGDMGLATLAMKMRCVTIVVKRRWSDTGAHLAVSAVVRMTQFPEVPMEMISKVQERAVQERAGQERAVQERAVLASRRSES